MMPQRQDPQYQRIAGDLLAQIGAGDLAPGAPVPSVRDIAAHYRVAQATAHNAIKALRDAGRIERHGSGMRVTRQPTLSSPGERLDRITTGGPLLRPGQAQRIIAAILDDQPPASVITHLDLDPGQPAGCREYTVVDRDGQVVTYACSWVRPEVWDAVPALWEARPLLHGIIGAVHEATGRRTVRLVVSHVARQATSVEVECLGLPAGAYVLGEDTACLDADGGVVEYNESAHRPGYRI